MRFLLAISVVFSFLCAPQSDYAQELNAPCHEASCCCDCLLCRDQLTGDWYGHRPSLAENGIVFESALTQFYQGAASGGAEQTFRYGDKLDLFILADTDRMGLWQGGKIKVHAVDWQFGQNVIADAAGLAPVNANLVSPRIIHEVRGRLMEPLRDLVRL